MINRSLFIIPEEFDKCTIREDDITIATENT